MPFAQLIASLIGIGIAGAKSSHDLKKQAQSPQVQAGMQEFHYMYDPVPRRKGYCRVMEWDLIHKKIRDDAKEYEKYIEEEYHLVRTVQYCWPDEWNKFTKQHPKASVRKASGAWYKSTIEAARAIGWWDWIRRNHPEYPGEPIIKPEDDKFCHRVATSRAQRRWFEEAHPEYQGKFPPYNYQTYVLEYARKAVYESGYIPSCQTIGKTRNWEYDTMYDGRLYGLGSDSRKMDGIDWVYGIPDQEYREKIIERDKKYSY